MCACVRVRVCVCVCVIPGSEGGGRWEGGGREGGMEGDRMRLIESE